MAPGQTSHAIRLYGASLSSDTSSSSTSHFSTLGIAKLLGLDDEQLSRTLFSLFRPVLCGLDRAKLGSPRAIKPYGPFDLKKYYINFVGLNPI